LKFAQICPKQTLKHTIFINIKKWPNGQTILFLANSFKKRPNLADLAFKKAKWQPCYFVQNVKF